jgi:hypothetical protein
VAIRRGAYLRAYVYDFIQTFASPLTRQVVEQALSVQHDGSSFEISPSKQGKTSAGLMVSLAAMHPPAP